MTRFFRFFLLACLAVGFASNAMAGDTCTLGGTCSAGSTIVVNVTNFDCGGANCPGVGSCTHPVTLTGNADYTITIAGGCSTSRKVAVCQSIVNSGGSSICTDCNILLRSGSAAGTTHSATLSCGSTGADTYAYKITVNDITCDVSGTCQCSSACLDSNCNCACDAEASEASCGIVVS